MNTTDGDLSNTCRVCLEKSLKLYPLEGQILNVDVYISTMINYCTSIEVVVDKDLPKAVCVPCFRTIRIAYNFIKQFRETNERLLAEREMLKNSFTDGQDECEDIVECKEEVKEELSDNSITNDLSESLSDQNCSSPEEKIIITYVNDDNNSDHELTSTEILSENNDRDTSENDEKTVKIKENLSRKNILLNRHMCPVCNNIFQDFKRGLIRHLYHYHHDDFVRCNKCSLETEMSIDLYIQHYTKSHLYQCPICKKKLGSKSSFYYHSRAHFAGGAYNCRHKNCKKAFQTQLSLQKHLQTHSDAPKYVCSKCGKNFNTYDTFRYHSKTHDGKRNHLCNICGRMFLQAVHLKYHMWHHTGIKQFLCGDCDKSYTSVTQLKKHRRKYCGSIKTSNI